jgi:hypothetical protein
MHTSKQKKMLYFTNQLSKLNSIAPLRFLRWDL